MEERALANNRPFNPTVSEIGSTSTSITFNLTSTATKSRLHQCTVCGERFSDQNRHRQHMITHLTNTSFPRPSDTANTANLINDTDLSNKNKSHQCRHCNKLFATSYALNVHTRIHTGEKPHPCQICEKNFSSGYALNVHMRCHTGEKPYQCQSCDKRFASLSNLKKHTMIHMGYKPYECQVCGKRCSTAFNLRCHQWTHTNNPKPHQCQFCVKSFATASGLRVHVKSHLRKLSEQLGKSEQLGNPSVVPKTKPEQG